MSGDREPLTEYEIQMRNEMIRDLKLGSSLKLIGCLKLALNNFGGQKGNQKKIYQLMTEHDLGGKIKINKDDESDFIIRSQNKIFLS